MPRAKAKEEQAPNVADTVQTVSAAAGTEAQGAEAPQKSKPVKHQVVQPFRDKFTKQVYVAGQDVSAFDAERLKELVALGLVEATE